MRSSELFIYLLLAFGWLVFVVLQRVLRKPKPLGTIQDEESPVSDAGGEAATSSPPASPWEVDWGRDRGTTPAPANRPLRPSVRVAAAPVAREEFPAQSELEIARQLGRRQAAARRVSNAPRTIPHPHRPSLRTQRELRDAMVAAIVIGPCRAIDDATLFPSESRK